MRFAILIGLSMAAAMGHSATVVETTAPADRVLTPQTVRVTLSDTGAVTSVKALPTVPPSIAAVLEKSVPTWRFSPQQIDGVAVATTVKLRVWLTAVAVDGQYRLRVNAVQLDYYEVGAMVRPEYPAGMLRAGRGADVCIQVQIKNGEKSIVDVWVDGKVAGKVDPFARSARASMQAMHVTALDPSAPMPDGNLMYPMRYWTDGDSQSSDLAMDALRKACRKLVPETPGRALLLSQPDGSFL
jgi:hypothetical protein